MKARLRVGRRLDRGRATATGAADALLEDRAGRDREWNEGAARKRLLQFLDGGRDWTDPWVSAPSGAACPAILFT
jgi:hypothetical protein